MQVLKYSKKRQCLYCDHSVIFEYVADLMVVSNGAQAVFAAAQHMFEDCLLQLKDSLWFTTMLSFVRS